METETMDFLDKVILASMLLPTLAIATMGMTWVVGHALLFIGERVCADGERRENGRDGNTGVGIGR